MYSIAIPAYGRPSEFEELLSSIYKMNKLPNEINVCEDCSRERVEITKICFKWKELFKVKNCILNYYENETNLGYDANIRKLIILSNFKWVVLMGNDDVFLPHALENIDRFCLENPDIAVISRSFLRFKTDVEKPIGKSVLFCKDRILKLEPSEVKYIFRACGFFGGLVINKEWAHKYHTAKYDGALFYQIYLASIAFCTKGIGYISKPILAARTGNPPLFGEAGLKNHVKGTYSPKGRASMWKGIIDIADEIGNDYRINLVNELRKELMIRQSFHVFEMHTDTELKTLREMKNELIKLGLFNHWIPVSLYCINFFLRRYASIFYYVVRKIIQ